MKTGKLILVAAGTAAVGSLLYYRGAKNLVFDIDGFEFAKDGTLNMRIKCTNPNRFFGYPVPQFMANVFDSNSNLIGTVTNRQLQYIAANTTSYIYGTVNPDYANLIGVATQIALTQNIPTNINFNGLIYVGPYTLPFDTTGAPTQ